MLLKNITYIAVLGFAIAACSPTKFSGDGNEGGVQAGDGDSVLDPNGNSILGSNGFPTFDPAGNPIITPGSNTILDPFGNPIVNQNVNPIFDPFGNPIVLPNPFINPFLEPTGNGPVLIGGDNPNTTPTTPTVQCTDHVAFATSRWMRGNEVNPGGDAQLTGADQICTDLAHAANLCPTKSFKAVLSSGDIDAKDRISITGPVYNNATTKQLVVSSQSQFWQKNGWQSLITFDENKAAIPAIYPGSNNRNGIWTGSNDNGTRRRAQNCRNFSSTSGLGGAGSAYERDDVLFDGTFGAPRCDEHRKIYCISQ